MILQPFSPYVSWVYPLKKSENLRFSGGREMEHWTKMGQLDRQRLSMTKKLKMGVGTNKKNCGNHEVLSYIVRFTDLTEICMALTIWLRKKTLVEIISNDINWRTGRLEVITAKYQQIFQNILVFNLCRNQLASWKHHMYLKSKGICKISWKLSQLFSQIALS